MIAGVGDGIRHAPAIPESQASISEGLARDNRPVIEGYGVARALRIDPSLDILSTFIVGHSGYAQPDA